MKRTIVLLCAAALTSVASLGWTQDAEEFEEADYFFELNNTDNDLGFHGKLDGGPWRSIHLRDSKRSLAMAVIAIGQVRRQGLTELFFESAEPNFDEMSPEDFFARFPEGEYVVTGRGLDGRPLRSTSRVSHVMPAPPDGITVNSSPIDLDEIVCDDEDGDFGDGVPVVDSGVDVTIEWDEVDRSHPDLGKDGDIDVARYQLVVEAELDDDFETVYSIDLLPGEVCDETGVCSMAVPMEFIRMSDEWKFEVLVKEAFGGNQTATETCFFTEGGGGVEDDEEEGADDDEDDEDDEDEDEDEDDDE